MRKTVKLTEAEATSLQKAIDKKQSYSKTGMPIGKSPAEARHEAVTNLCKKHNIIYPGLFEFSFPERTITGDSLSEAEHFEAADTDALDANFIYPGGAAYPGGEKTENGPGSNPEPDKSLIPILPEELPALKVFSDLYEQALAILQVCNDQQVTDSVSEKLAIDVAKRTDQLAKELDKRRLQLNKVPQSEIDKRNALCKKLAAPLEAGVKAVKQRLTDYALEQEKARKEAERIRLEAEQKRKEQEQKEAERIDKIKGAMLQFETKSDEKIAALSSVSDLESFLKEINGWEPKQEFYQQFYEEIKDRKAKAILRAESRRPLLIELEASRKEAMEASKKNKAAQEAAQQKIRQQEEQIEKQKEQEAIAKAQEQQRKAQMEASMKITISSQLTAMGWPITRLESELSAVKDIYGSFTGAAEMLADFNYRFSERFQSYKEQLNLESQKSKNMRTTWSFKTIDLNLVPREYLQLNEKAVSNALASHREEVKAGMFKIPGIEFYSETKAVLTNN